MWVIARPTRLTRAWRSCLSAIFKCNYKLSFMKLALSRTAGQPSHQPEKFGNTKFDSHQNSGSYQQLAKWSVLVKRPPYDLSQSSDAATKCSLSTDLRTGCVLHCVSHCVSKCSVLYTNNETGSLWKQSLGCKRSILNKLTPVRIANRHCVSQSMRSRVVSEVN